MGKTNFSLSSLFNFAISSGKINGHLEILFRSDKVNNEAQN